MRFWVLHFGLGMEECGCGREAAMTVLERPSFGPGMCRKPCRGKVRLVKKQKTIKEKVMCLGGCEWE